MWYVILYAVLAVLSFIGALTMPSMFFKITGIAFFLTNLPVIITSFLMKRNDKKYAKELDEKLKEEE